MTPATKPSEAFHALTNRLRNLLQNKSNHTQQEFNLAHETLLSEFSQLNLGQSPPCALNAMGQSLMSLGEYQMAKDLYLSDEAGALCDHEEDICRRLQRAECDLQLFLQNATEERGKALVQSLAQLQSRTTQLMSSLSPQEADSHYWMVANATTLAQRTLQALLESRFGYLGCQHGTFAVFLMECSLALTTVKYLGLRLRLYACAISCFEALQSSEGHTCALQLSQRLLQQVLLLEKYESQDLPVPEETLSMLETCKRAAYVRIFKQKVLLGEGADISGLAEEFLGLVRTEDSFDIQATPESSAALFKTGRDVVSCLRELVPDVLGTASLSTQRVEHAKNYIGFVIEAATACVSLELESSFRDSMPQGESRAKLFLSDVFYFLKLSFVLDFKDSFAKLLAAAQLLTTNLTCCVWEYELFKLLQPLKFPDESCKDLPKIELAEVENRQVPVRAIGELAQFLRNTMKNATAHSLSRTQDLLVGTALYLWSPFCMAMFETIAACQSADHVPEELIELTRLSLTSVEWVLCYFRHEDVVLQSKVCFSLAALAGFVKKDIKSAIQVVRRGLGTVDGERGRTDYNTKTLEDIEVDLLILLFTFELAYCPEEVLLAQKRLQSEFKHNCLARAILSACCARLMQDTDETLQQFSQALEKLEEAVQADHKEIKVSGETCFIDVVGTTAKTVTLRVTKTGEGEHLDINFKVFGKAFSNTEVSVNNCDLVGTGLIISIPAGEASKEVVVSGLRSNAAYRFAIGVCDAEGAVLGKLSESSGPIYTRNRLPLLRCSGFLMFCVYEALPLLSKSETRTALQIFFQAAAFESPEFKWEGREHKVLLWRENPMEVLRLRTTWNRTTSRISVQAAVHMLFLEIHVQHEFSKDKEQGGCQVKQQIQALQCVQKMLTAAKLALFLQDDSLALQACTLAYNSTIPCLKSAKPDTRLIRALVTLHQVLGKLRTSWEESAPLVYCRVTFALLRLLLAHEEKEVFASLLTEDARELINNSTNVHDLKAVLALDLRLSIGVGANELEAEEKDPGEVISEDSVFGLISSEEQEDLDEAWRLISVSGSEHHERYLQLAYLTFTVALANAHGELPKWIAEFQESLWDIHHTAESSLTQGAKDVLMEEEFKQLPFSCGRARTFPFYVADKEEEEAADLTESGELGAEDAEAAVIGETAVEGDNEEDEEKSVEPTEDERINCGTRLYETELTPKERHQLCLLGSLELCSALAVNNRVSPALRPEASSSPGDGPYACIEFKLTELEKENNKRVTSVPPLDLAKKETLIVPESDEKLQAGDEVDEKEMYEDTEEAQEANVMKVLPSLAKSIHRSRWAQTPELAKVAGRHMWNLILRARLSPMDFKSKGESMDWRYLWIAADCLLEITLDKDTEVWRENLLVFVMKLLCVLDLPCEVCFLGKRFIEAFGQDASSSRNVVVVRTLAVHACNSILQRVVTDIEKKEGECEQLRRKLAEKAKSREGKRSRKQQKKSPEELEYEESLEGQEAALGWLRDRANALEEEVWALEKATASGSQAEQGLEHARRLARRASLAEAEPGSAWISKALEEIKSSARSKGSSRTFAGLSARSGVSSSTAPSPRSRTGQPGMGKKGTSRRIEVDGTTRLWRHALSAYSKTLTLARERQETVTLACAYSEMGDVYASCSESGDVRAKAISSWKNGVDSVLQQTDCISKWRKLIGCVIEQYPGAGISEGCTETSAESVGQSCLRAFGLSACLVAANCAAKVATALHVDAAGEAIEYLRLATVLYSTLYCYGMPHPTRKCDYIDYVCSDLPKELDIALHRSQVVSIAEVVDAVLTTVETLSELGNTLDLVSLLPIVTCAQHIVDTFVQDNELSETVKLMKAELLIELGYLTQGLSLIKPAVLPDYSYDAAFPPDEGVNYECLQQIVALQTGRQTEENESETCLSDGILRVLCCFIVRATEGFQLSNFQKKYELLDMLQLSDSESDSKWALVKLKVLREQRKFKEMVALAEVSIMRAPASSWWQPPLLDLLRWLKQRCLIAEALFALRRLDDCIRLCNDTLDKVNGNLRVVLIYQLLQTLANALLLVGQSDKAYDLLSALAEDIDMVIKYADHRFAEILLKRSVVGSTYEMSFQHGEDFQIAPELLRREKDNLGVGDMSKESNLCRFFKFYQVFVMWSMYLKKPTLLQQAIDLTGSKIPNAAREHSHLLYTRAVQTSATAPTVTVIRDLLGALTTSAAAGNEYSLVLRCLEALYLLFAFRELPQVSREFASKASHYCLIAGLEVQKKQNAVCQAEEIKDCGAVADLTDLKIADNWEGQFTYKDIIQRSFQANQDYLLTFHPVLKEEAYHLHNYLRAQLAHYREHCCVDLGTLPDIDEQTPGVLGTNDSLAEGTVILQLCSDLSVLSSNVFLCVHLVQKDSTGELECSNKRFVLSATEISGVQSMASSEQDGVEKENALRAILGLEAVESSSIDGSKLMEAFGERTGGIQSKDPEVFGWWQAACLD